MTGAAPIFETFGCRLNAYESEAMKSLAAANGVGDAVVVNTCAVTAEAVRQARQQIRRQRRQNPDARLVVTGCAAQTRPQDFAAMPEVDLVIGNREKLDPATWRDMAHDLPRVLPRGPAKDRVRVGDIMGLRTAPAPLIDGLGSRSRAHVQVQNGCDHRCTFCIIPFGRGNARSVDARTVVEQVKRLRDKGFNEIVLTGVDMTSWGADLDEKARLGDLVQAILAAVPDLARLRISSIDSIEADPALIDAIASDPRLMPHLHLSLQSGDDMILKRMKRRHLREDAIAFCTRIRALRPDIAFGADMIAGFPTETETMFENTARLIGECGLTWLHVFPYSRRQGTPAARMPQVDGREIRARAAHLRALGENRVAAYLASEVGKTLAVLMESPRMGRTPGFAPVRFGSDRPVGTIVEATVTSAGPDHLRAA